MTNNVQVLKSAEDKYNIYLKKKLPIKILYEVDSKKHRFRKTLQFSRKTKINDPGQTR